MEYIIDPMFFYWVQICDYLSGLLLVIGTLLLVGFVIIRVFTLCEDWDDFKPATRRKLTRTAIIAPIVGLVLVIIGMLIPNSETLISMQITKLATPDNLNTVIDTIINATKEIIQILQGG